MTPRRVPRLALALVVLCGAPAVTQETGLSATQLREDIDILDTLLRFDLTRAQADAIVLILPRVLQQVDERETARTTMLRDVGQDLVAQEWAILNNQPPDAARRQRIATAWQRYERTRLQTEERIDSLLGQVYSQLTPAQRTLIEPAAEAAARAERERVARENRNLAVQQAVSDMLSWARSANAPAFAAERDTRARAVLTTAYPDLDAEAITALVGRVTGLYEQARNMNAAQFNALRRNAAERVRQTLFAAPVVDPAGLRYIMTADEWPEFWQNRRTAVLLAQLAPALGDAQ